MTVRLSLMRLAEGEGLPLPRYAHAGDAAFDVAAAVPADAPVTLMPGERRQIPTGFRVRVPDGYELELRPRSGAAIRQGLTMANSPATIDSSYRGHLFVLSLNLGQEPIVIGRGDRIAQGVVRPVVTVEVAEDPGAFAEATTRGDRGLGSTGRGPRLRLGDVADADLLAAAALDDLDEATSLVQARAGIDDGGVAALTLEPEGWATAATADRVARLRAWLEVERLHDERG